MQQQNLRAILMTCVVLTATAGTQAADGSVQIRTNGQPREVTIAVKNGAGACGMEVRFGDGRVETRSLLAGENWFLRHSYGAEGNFTIRAEGVRVVRGFYPPARCSFSQQALLAIDGSKASLWPVAADEGAGAADAQPSKQPQGSDQDILLMVNKAAGHLKIVNTLEGVRRLSSSENLAKSGIDTCFVRLPNTYGGLPDKAVLAAAQIQLRRYLSERAGGKEVEIRPVECIYSSGNEIRFMALADIVMVQRQVLPALRKISPQFEQEHEQVHEFSHTSVFAMAKEQSEAAQRREQDLANRALELDNLAQAHSTDKVGSLSFGLPRDSGTLAFCTLSYSGDQGAAILGYAQRGLATQSEEFRAAAERARATVDPSRPFTQTYPSLEALFEARQTEPEDCSVYVDFPANLKKLATALQRDNQNRFELNALIDSASLRDDWARRANYQDYAQYRSSREMNVNAQQLKTLGHYRISDKAGLDSAVREMQASRYSNGGEVSDLLNYLKDKAEAAGKPGASAVSVRDARQKAAKEAADAQAASERRQRVEYGKQFPFIAVLTCGLQQHLNVLACFAGGRGGVGTEVKLRNGDKMNLYKVYNLREAGQERSDGFHIDLRSKFSLQAQNSSEALVLGLKIIHRVSGRVIYNDQAARYGVVRAGN